MPTVKQPTKTVRITSRTTLKLAEYKPGREQLIHEETGGHRNATTEMAIDELLETQEARRVRERAASKSTERL